MNSITKRWVRGSLFFMLAVLLLAEGIFLYYMITGYYNGVNDAIIDQLGTLRTQMQLADSTRADTNQNQNRAASIYRIVEQFEEKTRFELMLVNGNGEIVSSSSGVVPAQAETPLDISAVVQQGASESSRFVSRNETGEKVMAITMRTPYAAGGVVAVRLVTSLAGVDRAILNLVIASLVFLLVIILAYIASGLYFIRSIVIPLRKVETTAAHISQGDFNTRIDNNANDEIGSLCKTINNMAEELSKSEQMKNEFISSVSHELRTPLTSIKGWVETVGNMENTDGASYRRGVEIISSETDRLYDMVEELLDFSRMQNGIELNRELLDLAAEVEDAVLIVVKRAESLGLLVDYDVPELPIPVMADKNRIRQVLVNILDNAIKYSYPGGHITVTAAKAEKDAQVVITDEGKGISAEDLEHVKVKFFKGKGAVRGSGIGLAVVDEVMRAHNGTVSIASEEGNGTEVTLTLPVHIKRSSD